MLLYFENIVYQIFAFLLIIFHIFLIVKKRNSTSSSTFDLAAIEGLLATITLNTFSNIIFEVFCLPENDWDLCIQNL